MGAAVTVAAVGAGLGVAAGALTALTYGLGSVLQAVGARRAPTATGLDPRLLVRLLGHWQYVLGLALDAVGFIANVIALHWLPLFVVECLIAGSVGVTAVAAALLLDVRLTRRAVASLGLLLAGLGLLAAGARPGPARGFGIPGEWVMLAAAVLLLGVGLAAARLQGRAGLLALAAAAGAAFGGVGVSARGLKIPQPWWHLVGHPSLWALVAFGLLGTLALATALQRGSVTVASAVMFAVETTIPAVIGLALLGDRTRPGLGVAAAVLGFVATLAGSIGLAAYGELTSGGDSLAPSGAVGPDLS